MQYIPVWRVTCIGNACVCLWRSEWTTSASNAIQICVCVLERSALPVVQYKVVTEMRQHRLSHTMLFVAALMRHGQYTQGSTYSVQNTAPVD